MKVYVAFDGPAYRKKGRFVGIQDESGRSIGAGEWAQTGEQWRLGPFEANSETESLVSAVQAAIEFAEKCSSHDSHCGGVATEEVAGEIVHLTDCTCNLSALCRRLAAVKLPAHR